MDEEITFDMIVDAWRQAARSLSFKIVAPYALSGTEIQFVAYLPNFGGPKGILISFMGDANESVVASAAKASGHYYSLSNPERYCKYEAEHFKDTLIDWGFFGDPNRKPDWMP